MLLDLGLPDGDGLDVCRILRSRSDVPIIVVSARSDEADRVVGLELGADDYVSKPFGVREVIARIRATKTLDVHVSALRRKLAGALTFETVRGVGFRLVVEPTAATS